MIPKELRGSKKKERKRLYLEREKRRKSCLDDFKKLEELGTKLLAEEEPALFRRE